MLQDINYYTVYNKLKLIWQLNLRTKKIKMQAKKRYLLLISCCAFLSIGYFGYYHWKTKHEKVWFQENLDSFIEHIDIIVDEDISANPREKSSYLNTKNDKNPYKNCRMETCFDFTICDNDFKVYVYPIDENVPPSASYYKVIKAIKGSKYYTSNPSQACVFVLSLDTLDRDTLSKEYVRNMQPRVQRLSLWNNGQNHIIFNLYSGTWPDYSEAIDFDIGKAIIAKASISIENFRPNFDISLPLFHKTHSAKGGKEGFLKSNNFPGSKKYLLGFKGKRYVYGIGSETRNTIFHLHNNKDVVLVTTCKHGGSWKEHKDERCDNDNLEYDKFDYEELLVNSSFCLVPRGRRLGSFRFLEVLQASCIPVLLANEWELPFAEVIDWSKAAIWSDERLLLQVPDVIRSILPSVIMNIRQQTQILWNQYFSSVEKIIISSLEIVKERVNRVQSKSVNIWNTTPGALHVNLQFSDYLPNFPFYYSVTGTDPSNRFTAVIYVRFGWGGAIHVSPLYKLIKNIAKSKYVKKILVIWNSLTQMPPVSSSLPGGDIPLVVVVPSSNESLVMAIRYTMHSSATTDAVFSFDEDSTLTSEEMDFAFLVWKIFPDRIVGYPARNHFWDQTKNAWAYSSKMSNSYSLVLTSGAIYHKYYQYVLVNSPADLLLASVMSSTTSSYCDDILLNVLVADIIRRPPIKLSQRRQYRDPSSEAKRLWSDPNVLKQRTACMNSLLNVFEAEPLQSSNLRLDPVLFKDKVSIQRKKYRQMEKNTS